MKMEKQQSAMSAESSNKSRFLVLRRAFQRALGTKPTIQQKLLRDRAAVLTVKAEAAALDPATSANDVVRLDGAAARARAAMFESFGKKLAPAPVSMRGELAAELVQR
jgi:hypothetical protein